MTNNLFVDQIIKESKTGQLFQSNIENCPVFIPSKISSNLIEEKMKIQNKFKDFDLSYVNKIQDILKLYFTKFISGDRNTYSNFSDIPLIDLYLWEQVKTTKNPYVKRVFNSIQRFDKAINTLSKTNAIEPSLLVRINTSLRPKDSKLGIRKSSIRAGNPNNNPNAFYCLPAKLINEYINDFLEFIHSRKEGEIQGALLAYQQFVFIHPFVNGNGRMARAFLIRELQQKNHIIYAYFMTLYLKNINRLKYNVALKDYRNGNTDHLNMFYSSAIEWVNSSIEILIKLIYEYIRTIGVENFEKLDCYSQIIIKDIDCNFESINPNIFKPHTKKANNQIFINTALLSVLNQLDYYLRFQLRGCFS